MGGKSSVTVEVMNKSLVETAMQVMNACQAEAKNAILLRVGNVGGDLNLGGKDSAVTQTAKSRLNCTNKTDIDSAMKSALESAMKANSSAQSNSILEGSLSIFSQSDTNQKLVNETIMETNLDVVAECMQESSNVFEVSADDIAGNVNFQPVIDQNAEAEMAMCINEAGISTEMAQDISNKLEASSKTTGLMGTIMDGLGNMTGTVVIVAIVLGILALSGFFAKKAMDGSGEEDEDGDEDEE
jgi:hypothetical protein